jgi:tetratricopeptide (TPR) repeat protein
MKTKTKIIFTIIGLFAVSFVGYYIYDAKFSPVLDPEPLDFDNVRGSTSNINMPDLDRPINMPDSLPEDAQKIAREKIEDIAKNLKENPKLFNYWLELGVYRKMINDYEGAAEVWEYAGVISPKNSTSFNNLGDIYAYYLKDNKKAEENFLKALENDPNKIYIYRNVYEFYRYVMKDTEKSRQILEKGIELNLDTSQDLQNLLNNF